MQFPRLYLLKGFMWFVFSEGDLDYSWTQIATWMGSDDVQPKHVCASPNSPAIDWMRACRRPISRAKLFITEVHIRTSSGRPPLQARLGGNYHSRWQRMQTTFEETPLLLWWRKHLALNADEGRKNYGIGFLRNKDCRTLLSTRQPANRKSTYSLVTCVS